MYQWQDDDGDSGHDAPVHYSIAKVMKEHEHTIDVHVYQNVNRATYLDINTFDLQLKFAVGPGADMGYGKKYTQVGLDKDDALLNVEFNNNRGFGKNLKKASKTAAIAAIKENEEIGDEGEGDSDIDD